MKTTERTIEEYYRSLGFRTDLGFWCEQPFFFFLGKYELLDLTVRWNVTVTAKLLFRYKRNFPKHAMVFKISRKSFYLCRVDCRWGDFSLAFSF